MWNNIRASKNILAILTKYDFIQNVYMVMSPFSVEI